MRHLESTEKVYILIRTIIIVFIIMLIVSLFLISKQDRKNSFNNQTQTSFAYGTHNIERVYQGESWRT